MGSSIHYSNLSFALVEVFCLECGVWSVECGVVEVAGGGGGGGGGGE